MSEVDDIKQKMDIVDFVSGYVQLRKAGVNYKGLCPFHAEKTPSFMVSAEKQIWHCFGCNEGGDVFSFLMKIENLEFGDALRMLADRTGVQLKKISPALTQQKTKLYEINLLAAKFYHLILTEKKAGQPALDYLRKRGLSPETIKEWQLGYAPNSFEVTSAFLRKRDFSEAEIRSAGLCIPRQSGSGSYDRFRGRIMFPISDQMGKVIGFTGRAFTDESGAKYLNSPDTPIYNKSVVIFGLSLAKEAIKAKKYAILTEGNMDVIASHQAGFKNTIASSGTAFTPDQLTILKRFCANLILAFDSDNAGIAATKRLIALALSAGFNLKVVKPDPSGKDPDEYLQRGRQVWAKMLQNAVSPIDYYLAVDFGGQKEVSTAMKRAKSGEILSLIRQIPDPIIQGDYLSRLANLLQMEEKYLYESLKKAPTPDNFGQPSQPAALPSNLEERLISLLIKTDFPKLTVTSLLENDFQDPDWRTVYKLGQSFYNEKDRKAAGSRQQAAGSWQLEAGSKKKLAEKFWQKHPLIARRLEPILLKIEDEFADFPDLELKPAYEEELAFCLVQKVEARRQAFRQSYIKAITSAEAQGDRAKVKELVKQFQQAIIKQQTTHELKKPNQNPA